MRPVPAPSLSAPPSPAPPAQRVPPASSRDDDEAIVVTGSRVRRDPSYSTSPTVTVDDTEAARGSAFQRRRGQRAPEPGLLTAGDHDDLLNPELYASYVDDFLKRETLPGVPRVDTRQALTVAVQDTAGRAVPFAAVTLTCSDGNQLTLATTANGAAVFFPELDRLGARVSVSVRYGARDTAGRPVSFSRRLPALRQTVIVDRAAAPLSKFDLALVVDTTGSMTDELNYLKVELDSILDALRRSHPQIDMRVALIAYRDTDDAYITRTFAFTSDISALRGHLAEQHAGGGGDYPEAVEQAMARAMALDWRDDAVRSLLFVADAPPHADDVAATWRSAEVARARRIQIVPVGASGVGPGAEYMMRAMAAVTQSRYIFLTDDSGIGNPHAPPSVDCYLVTSLKALIERVLDAQLSGRRVEPRDEEIVRSVGNYRNGRCAPR